MLLNLEISARCYKAELFYDVVKSKRRHWFAVTLSFTPCGDCQSEFYLRRLEESKESGSEIYLFQGSWRENNYIPQGFILHELEMLHLHHLAVICFCYKIYI